MSAKNQRCAAGARDKDPLEEEDKHTHAREDRFLFSLFPFIVPATVRRMDRGREERRKKEKLCLQGLSGRSPGLEEEKGRGGGTEEEEEPLGARDHIL